MTKTKLLRSRRLPRFGLMIGIILAASTSVQAAEEVVFRDDFTGTSLRPEWTVLGNDADRWTLIDNEYLLIVMTNTEKGPKNEFEYDKPLPENCEIEVKFQTPPQQEGQVIRLRLTRDDKNFISLQYEGKDSITWGKNVRDEWSAVAIKPGNLSGPLFFKIKKKGVEYTGFYSLDGKGWSPTGTNIFPNLNGRPRISAYTYKQYDMESFPPEDGIRVDYFEIRTIK